MNKDRSDQELVREFCEKQNNKAFDEIFMRYMSDVYRYIYSRILQKELTEDIVSETFLTLYRCLGAYNGASSLKSFIIGIAINKMRHAYRDNQKRKEVTIDMDILPSFEDIEEYDELAEEEMDAMIATILVKLPENYRYILEHMYIHQEPLSSIAKSLDITQNNARVLHHRALKKAIEIAKIIKS